jgi:SAM-dependent MidA family methyltransferase
LNTPGENDLTAHVDFRALGRTAAGEGACVYGPLAQGEFLRRLGIEERARILRSRAIGAQGEQVEKALTRLVDGGPTGMGELFKAIAFAHPRLGPLPGFDS